MKANDTKIQTKTKRRSFPYVLGGFVLLLLTLLIILQASNLWKTLSVETASDTLLLYALSSLNFVAFVVFAFIFIRNILKLVRERRALQLGSKIKTRLLVFFCAVSLLPLIAMAVFSSLFMNRAIERWFADIPESVVREARNIQFKAAEEQFIKLTETARMLTIVLQNPTSEDLNKLVEAGDLTHVEILAKDGSVLAESEKRLNDSEKAELEKTLRFIRQNNFDDQTLRDGKGFDAAAADFPDGRRLVIIPDLQSGENVNQLFDRSLEEFDRLKNEQLKVRQIAFTTLGLLTFLLIFAASWTAFYIAKGLTVPIKALAEGADEIARGNLGHRVEVLAEDELALLVTSFNQMSAKLEENSAELDERRRYIETVLQSLTTGVISFDAETKVSTINKAAVQILRLENADFTRFELNQLVGEENRAVLERLLARAKRIGQASEQTVLQREAANGQNADAATSLPVALTAKSLPNDGGVVLVIEDLSELIAAQRASAWAEVARRMAHEIKNPLTPIQLSAERIAKRFAPVQSPKSKVQSFLNVFKAETEDESADTEEQNAKVIREGTQTILREVSSLKSMVDEFSRFARLPNAKLESGNLNRIIEQSVLLYEDRHSDVRIITKLAENLPNTLIDEEQLKRVFVNLIDNAIEVFDPPQAEKRIDIRTFYDKARDLVVAEVSDNGRGIPPSDFQKLFQPYFSTKGRGTGLGLAIVHRIITEHHGKIKAVNNSPKGAKFIVELPVMTN
jgi:two-component system, NtrC family, nitrogen regulation sensor histidine kinase NtrY